jgi:hypothetical protein
MGVLGFEMALAKDRQVMSDRDLARDERKALVNEKPGGKTKKGWGHEDQPFRYHVGRKLFVITHSS